MSAVYRSADAAESAREKHPGLTLFRVTGDEFCPVRYVYADSSAAAVALAQADEPMEAKPVTLCSPAAADLWDHLDHTGPEEHNAILDGLAARRASAARPPSASAPPAMPTARPPSAPSASSPSAMPPAPRTDPGRRPADPVQHRGGLSGTVRHPCGGGWRVGRERADY